MPNDFLNPIRPHIGKRTDFRAYADTNRAEAEQARFNLELQIAKSRLNEEVVLLDASNEAALRITHSRYFDDVDQMAERLANSTSAWVAREHKG